MSPEELTYLRDGKWREKPNRGALAVGYVDELLAHIDAITEQVPPRLVSPARRRRGLQGPFGLRLSSQPSGDCHATGSLVRTLEASVAALLP